MVVVEAISEGSSASFGATVLEIIDHSTVLFLVVIIMSFEPQISRLTIMQKRALALGVSQILWLGQTGNLLFVPVNLVTT